MRPDLARGRCEHDRCTSVDGEVYRALLADGTGRLFCKEHYLLDFSEEHLGYEIGRLFSSIVRRRGETLPGDFGNFLTESFALHLRNLIDFIYPAGLFSENRPPDPEWRNPRDIGAEEFVVSVAAWRTSRGKPSLSMREARTRANREVAHLTMDRIRGIGPRKLWSPVSLLWEIVPLFGLFHTHASAQRLHVSIVERIRMFEEAIPKFQQDSFGAPSS
ncbi:MAG TPA: hypothetical protein VFI25_12365 [Planctomycetota bacterium]|jgi:hypothetical protein|nr:hypothetical protein [Planctomycetota bacterium]